MELGKAKLRKVGLNNLYSAVHPQHGVIWTDGTAIYLAPIHVQGHQVQNATSVKLGQFEHVTSVHWSSLDDNITTGNSTNNNSNTTPSNNKKPDSSCSNNNTTSTNDSSISSTTACYLCVVHQQNVSVWRVSGALPRLNFKQVRKINVRPVPQGCLWHPNSDVLCLLSRHQCSFYYRHDHNKGSYAFPSLESGKISCGTWSPDGTKLILCIGTALLIYRWKDVANDISDFSAVAWRIPELEGMITSISPITKDSVVVATEIPLETLCKQTDMFSIPEISSNKSTDGVIRPNGSASVSDSLMNLRQNEQVVSRSSSLVMIQLQDTSGDPIKLSSVPLKGVITPDILLYECNSQCVVVGSNSQSQIHIYALLEKHLAYCGDVQLEKGQRPKGLCSMLTALEEKGAALLILVGQREKEESAVLSPSVECDFRLFLKYIILKSGHDHRAKHKRSGSHKTRSSLSPGASGDTGEGTRNRSLNFKKNSSLSKSESMKEHSIPTKTSLGRSVADDNHNMIRGRSSSVRHDTSVTDTGVADLNTIVSATVDEETALDAGLVLPNAGIETSVHKGKLVQDLSSSSSTTSSSPRDLETVPFSSQPPSFNNAKLLTKYELSQEKLEKGTGSKLNNNQTYESLMHNSLASHESTQKVKNMTYGQGLLNEADIKVKQKATKAGENRETVVNQEQGSKLLESLSRPTNVLATSTKSPILPDNENVDDDSTVRSSRSSLVSSGFVDGSPRLSSPTATINEHDRSHQQSRVSPIWPGNDLVSNGGTSDGWDEMLQSEPSLGASLHSNDSGFVSVEKQVKSQRSTIESLQQRLQQLALTVEDTACVFPTKYQDMNKPEMIEVECRRNDGNCETKKFLLDNGRLKLETIRLAFGLSVVELFIDDVPIVLSANIDGYIPIKFTPASTLHITGLPLHGR